MGVTTKWVFPILRMLLLTIVVIALVKLAFFTGNAETADPAVPTGEVTQPQVEVVRGTVANDVKVTGSVRADPALPLKATGVGTVDEVFIAEGSVVNKGDKIFDIRVETMPDAAAAASGDVVDLEANETTEPAGAGGDRNASDEPTTPATGAAPDEGGAPAVGTESFPEPEPIPVPQPIISFARVYAPADGVLSSLTVIPGQLVAVGEVSGQVAPPTFSVSGSMSPEQMFGLIEKPTQAEITITNGPAPFTCEGLQVTTALAGAGGDADDSPDLAGAGGGSGTIASCAVPADVRVFAGLTAELLIPGGVSEDVLTVPTTAVKGSSDTGIVWFLLPDGATEEREVTLGLNDGTMVEIVDGLEEGDQVLEFVPGAVPIDPWADWEPGMPEPMMDGCDDDGSGTVICEDAG